MRISILSDLHLFSTDIGGRWNEQSFEIFKEIIIPELMNRNPDMIIFLGDIIDPGSGRIEPRWSKGDGLNELFVKVFRENNIIHAYALKGNHDYVEPLRNISDMHGPKFIDDDWVINDDVGLYFFSSRYPDIERGTRDITLIPEIHGEGVNRKILLMHENLTIPDSDENISLSVMREVNAKFDIILNGHQHREEHIPNTNIWCLSSCLPWRVNMDTCDVIIDSNLKINRMKPRHGFYILETDNMNLDFIPINTGIKTVIAKIIFHDADASEVREKLKNLSELIHTEFSPMNTIVRVYLEGTLKKGTERIDIGFKDLRKYFIDFYEGNKDIIKIDNLIGGGAYLSKTEITLPTVKDAIKYLSKKYPEIGDFYKEIEDLLEKKSLDRDTLVERIKQSKTIEKVMAVKEK